MSEKFNTSQNPIKLYRNPKSGHCHRVELMLALLNLPYDIIDLDMVNGAHKHPEYLKKSPFGQVPAIDDNGLLLADSNAIITYLACHYGNEAEWAGRTAEERALIQQWLSIAAGEIASGPAAARLVTVFGAELDHDAAKAKAIKLFDVMNSLLAGKNFLVSDRLTLADIACYSYIAHAPEGGVYLDNYPNIRNWLASVAEQAGFIAMATSPIPKSV